MGSPEIMPAAVKKEDGENKAEDFYNAIREEYGLVASDVERALNKTNRYEYVTKGAPEEFRDLYDRIEGILDVGYEDLPAYTEKILGAIRNAAREKKWESWDDYSFDAIGNELEAAGLPLKARKKSSDYQ